MLSFFTVLAALLFLVPMALGYEAMIFLNDNIVIISVLFWLLMITLSISAGRKESNMHDRWLMYIAPVNLLPLWCFLSIAATDLAVTSGFDILWAALEIPFVGLVLLSIGLSIGLIFGKIKSGPLAALLTITANVIISCMLLSYGL